LARAKARAHAVSCLNNNRQFNLAHQMYIADSRGRSLDYNYGIGLWIERLMVYAGTKQNTNANIRLCPVARNRGYDIGNGMDFMGSVTGYWGPLSSYFGTSAGSYGAYAINGWVYSDNPPPSVGSVPTTYYFGRVETAQGLSQIPFIGDAVWLDAWPQYSQNLPADTFKGNPADAGLGRFGINRHNAGINLAFMDGSARYIKLNKLKTLKWSTDPNWSGQ
jgi:prepilin-type processing-associated H-X9-DG protein